jgi:hypothetical protein
MHTQNGITSRQGSQALRWTLPAPRPLPPTPPAHPPGRPTSCSKQCSKHDNDVHVGNRMPTEIGNVGSRLRDARQTSPRRCLAGIIWPPTGPALADRPSMHALNIMA